MDMVWLRFDERLLLLLNRPPLFLLSPEVEDARSRLESFLFEFELNALFSRLPGETLRFLLLRSSGILNIGPDEVAGLESSPSRKVSEPVVLGPLTADSTSACASSVSFGSTEVVLINGEEEV
jgi:hypothetical protein